MLYLRSFASLRVGLFSQVGVYFGRLGSGLVGKSVQAVEACVV
jgi:hypothetical protein